MSHKKSASVNGKSLSRGRTLDEEELALRSWRWGRFRLLNLSPSYRRS